MSLGRILTPAQPRRIRCNYCQITMNRARLLLLTADALEAGGDMERIIIQMIRDAPSPSARQMLTESLTRWQQATEAINRCLGIEGIA